MQSRRALSGMVLSLVFLVAALAPGCTDASSPKDLGLGDDPTATRGGNIAATVVVSLDTARATVGQPIHVSAVVKNSRGNVLSGKTIKWSISDTSLAWIEGGTIATKRPGSDIVRANVDDVIGQHAFTIVAAGSSSTPGPVASVKVVLDSSSLTIPHTAQASATLRDSSGTVVGGSVTWSSSNTSVATVSGTGVVSAIGAGTANIVGTSGTVTGNAPITVVAPITPIASVVVSLVSNSIGVGATTQATVTALDANNNVLAGRTVSWSSSNTAVATVDPATGIVTGVGAGSASITASSGGKTGAATVSVTTTAATVGSVSVNLALPSINVTGTTQATATVYDASHNVIQGRAVTWSSANTSVAMVNSTTGVVTGAGAGTAAIVATASGISGTATITVGAPKVATVSVSLASSSINVGTSTQATATARDANSTVVTGVSVAWTSSNTAVASVNPSTGVVTGVAAGAAAISARAGERTGTTNITITSATAPSNASIASVSVSLNPTSMNIGGTSQATATTRDSANNVLTGRTIAWSSSNTAIAKVNASTGVVTGVAAGSASITATSGGKSGAATMTITTAAAPVVASVSVALNPNSINVGAGSQGAATVRDASNNVMTGSAVAWSSSNTAIATVNASTGAITGKAAGNASITATSGGKSGTATITINAVTLPPTGATSLFYNSSEAGCGSDPSIVLCEDFESGSWYSKDCDQANASGGLAQTKGWCGTIFSNPITPTGAAVCVGAGAKGTNCAASGGLHTGGQGGVNMADHNLGPSNNGYNEIWLRYYIKPSAGYQYGAQKMITFNSTPAGSGGISIGGSGSPFSDGAYDTCPVYDCNTTGAVYYYRQNQGSKLTLSQITGHWAYVEMHVKLNTPGQANGIWELWLNDCGTNGVCTGTPTLRSHYTTVQWQSPTDNKQIKSIWFENWANPGSVGTELYDQIMVKTSGPIGF